ncbi:MAG: zinc ribbon domain-containing protein [Bacteriovoracaceae bacterium]
MIAGLDEKACPKCAEKIKKEANECKHCGHDFS